MATADNGIDPLDIVEVDADSVDETSFFCLQSKPNDPGYQRKRRWLDDRFAEGLKIRMLGQRDTRRWNGERGFIEYIPGEHAWRAVNAADHLVVHCLWVVGRSRGKGGAKVLVDRCVQDAKDGGFAGVATVAAENGFATGRKFWEYLGFEAVATCEPRLSLMVLPLREQTDPPTFSAGPSRGPGHYGEGLTILRSDQCPYIDSATALIREETAKHEIEPVREVEMTSAADIRAKSPTPYGTFATVLDGQLLSYRYLTAKEFAKAVERVRG
jgi:GNAT superfamily N-acetyltransferase